jgi:hypothetical protein
MTGSQHSRPPFDSRLKWVLKLWLAPLLKSYGFKKSGGAYVREDRELAWLVDVQRSLWNDAFEVQFTLNCGIYVPGVVSTYVNRPEPATAKLKNCCITARIGMLSNSKRDHWWILRSDDDPSIVDPAIGKDIQERVKNDLVAFLQKFETREDVIEFLEEPRSKAYQCVLPQSEIQCLTYAAILYSMLERKEKCFETLNAAVEAAHKSPIEGVVKGVKERIYKDWEARALG